MVRSCFESKCKKSNCYIMKILWVNPSFLDYRIPVYRLLNELSGNNFYLLFSTNRVPERIVHKIKAAIGDHAICYEGERRIIFGKNEGMANKWTSIPITKGLYRKIKEVHADVVITEGFFQWTPKAILYAFWHRTPLLVEYERTKHTERNCPKWRTWYRRLIDKFTQGYLCNGILTKEYLIDVIKINERKLFIGGMSADSKELTQNMNTLSEFEIDQLYTQLSLNKNGLTYIYVGQLIERKGLIYLLKAWLKHIANHPYDNLLIVGGGELYNSFNLDFGQINSIHFTNHINYDEVYRYYAVSDVFIIPTLEDNWSLVVPEAMACGLPIACSIYNGCYPELVHEGKNGSLFDPLSEASILRSLDIFHHVDLSAYSIASQKIESKFNHERAATNIYNTIINFYKKQE